MPTPLDAGSGIFSSNATIWSGIGDDLLLISVLFGEFYMGISQVD
jgi:hypothetical protein